MKKLLTTALLVSLTHLIFSQNCEINANSNPIEITCGQSAVLSAFGSSTGSVILDEDFNTSGFGPGWGSTPGSTNFSNPCSPGGVDGTPHAWMDDNTSVPRTLTSAPYDLSGATAGVTICFDLLFASQGDASPCEGPDEPDEGVYLQYSTDGGLTWIDITYFDPNGGNDPQLTNWNNWCFTLPAGALTANTIIRWHQIADSGADYDHWGIDNVQIFQNDINAEIVWLHDGYSYGVGMPGGNNPTPVTPTTTTTYTAQITTGTGDVCTADITVIVNDPVYDINVVANPTSICPGDCATITGDAQIILDPGGIETYENNEFEVVASGSSSVNVNVQGINTNTIYNGLIQNVTINGFSFSGSSFCSNFGGCNCGSTTVSFGQTCTLDASSFTVTLTSPGGCTIILAPAGVANGNYTDVVFVPVGGTAFNGSFPGPGNWNPQEPFSNLNGCDPNGVWELSFDAPGLGFGFGTLFGWSITFDDPPIYAPVDIVWSPTTGLSNPNSINTDACPMVTTDYILTASNGTAGCAEYTETVTITVAPCTGCVAPVVNVVPISTCAPGTVDLFDAIAAGSDPATLSYHSTQADAQNDVSAISQIVGTSGSYWIRAEDPTDPLCFEVYEVVVTINPQDNATFALTDFCVGTANAASGIVTAGGTFTFNPNLGDGSSINGSNGSITNGVSGTTYTVEYTTAGACPASSTQTVSVNGLSYNATIVDETCGTDNGEIDLTPVGGSPAYTYSIDGGTSTQGTGSFNGLSSGNYSIEITDNNGCVATGTETIANVGGASIDNIVVVDESCPGACDGTITVTVSGGTTPYAYQWFDNAGSPVGTNSNVLSSACAGNYSVEVTDVSTCSSTDFATVGTGTTDDATFTLTDFCAGSANAASGIATPGGTFVFNPNLGDGSSINGSTGSITNGVSGTTYTVEYTTAGACPATSTQTVSVTGLTYNVSIVDETCGAGNGEINLTPVGGSPAYTYSIDGGTSTQGASTFTGLSSGNYAIEITDNNGCVATGNETIANLGGASIDNIVTVDESCPGACDGTITVTVSGGATPYTYQWYDNGGAPVGTNSNVLSSACAGNYSIEVTDAAGGTTQLFYDDFESGAAGWNLTSVQGPEGADPNFFAVNDNEGGVAAGGCGIANNGNSTLHITSVFFPAGGAAYDAGGLCGFLFCPQTNRQAESPLINTVGQTGLTLNFDFIAQGDVPNDQATVWYNDGFGWTQIGAPLFSGTGACAPQGTWTAYSSGLPASCENIANLQVAIRWQNNDDGAGTDPSVAINNIEIVTSSTATCSSTDFATVGTGTPDDATFTLTDFCAGSVNAASGIVTPGGTFTFNPDLGDGSIINSSTGEITNGVGGTTYTVDYTTSGACPATSTETVLVNGTPIIDNAVVVEESCESVSDGSITITSVSNGSGTYSYSWDIIPDPATAGITGLTDGNYTVTITDDNTGCQLVNAFTLNVGPVCCDIDLTVLATTQPSCGQADGSIDVEAIGGDGNYQFNIAGGVFGPSSSFINLLAGTYQIIVQDGTVTCADTVDVQLSDLNAPIITAVNGVDLQCNGNIDGEISVTANGGVGLLDYEIALGAPIANNASGVFTGLGGGNYSITVTDENGCQATDIIVINEPSIVTADVVSTNVGCAGSNDGSITVTGGGGTPDYMYSIDNGVTFNGSNSFTGLSAQNYTVVVQDANGCLSAANDVLISGSSGDLVVDVVVTEEMCFETCDGSLTLNVVGGLAPYDYTFNGVTSASNVASNLCAGNYDYTVSDANGCVSVGSEVIQAGVPVSAVAVNIIDDGCSESCDGSVQIVSATGVMFEFNGIVNGTGSFTDLCTGNYIATVTDANGCTGNVTVFIGTTLPAVANFSYSPNTVTMFENEVDLLNLSSNADTYLWEISGPNSYYESYSSENVYHIFPADTGTYQVCLTAENMNGCIDRYCTVVSVEEEMIVIVPNSFTPDGDAFNQTFKAVARGVGDYDFSFTIYNRWGQLIWESHDIEIGWDGTYKGILVQDGVYTWKVEVGDALTDLRKTYVGHVNILR